MNGWETELKTALRSHCDLLTPSGIMFQYSGGREMVVLLTGPVGSSVCLPLGFPPRVLSRAFSNSLP
jgi:hypothetical protein